MSDEVTEKQEAVPIEAEPEPETMLGVPVSWSRGQKVLHPSREQYLDVLWKLRDDEHFEMATDLCGVDYLRHPGRSGLPEGVEPQRFEVVLELLSLSLYAAPSYALNVKLSKPTKVPFGA